MQGRSTLARLANLRLLTLFAVAVSVLLIREVGPGAHASTVELGLLNPGFESTSRACSATGVFPPWSLTPNPPADAAVVVGEEGKNQFAAYADKNNGDFAGDITVTPYRDKCMLRLGTPKDVSSNQTAGDNGVSQTFHARAETLRLAYRIFSWESRGQDKFRVELRNKNGIVNVPIRVLNAATGQPMTSGGDPEIAKMPSGASATCTSLPCEISINVGKQGSLLDSAPDQAACNASTNPNKAACWRILEISGLQPYDANNPTSPNNDYTITYTAGGTKDQSKATWAYFDSGNTPPVAKFSFDPSSPIEGLPVRFTDQSFDPDPGDSIVAWEWKFSGPGIPDADPSTPAIDPVVLTTQNPLFLFPNNGDYTVCLKVTDTQGATASICDGQTVAGVSVANLVSLNASMLTGALNIEALPGVPAALQGRFLDPGVFDTHTASFSVGGASVTGGVEEEFGVGRATGTFTPAANAAPGTIAGQLTVQDNDGAQKSSAFNLNVVANDVNSRESNDTIADAKPLASGGSYLSYIGSPGDKDVFRVTKPGGGTTWEAGSEILLTLKDLPADFDLTVLTTTQQGTAAPFDVFPFEVFPFELFPFDVFPFDLFPFDVFPFDVFPFEVFPFEVFPFDVFQFNPGLTNLSLEQFPVSLLKYGVPTSQDLNGATLTLSELGLASINATNQSVAGYSLNRGTADERVLVRLDTNTDVYVVVSGYNGAFSANPYRLQVEASIPPSLPTVLGSACAGQALVPSGGTSTTQTLYSAPGAPKTLFVTQRERTINLYSDPDAAAGQSRWNGMLSQLQALSNHSDVGGKVISVPSSIYDAWDTNPCSVSAANAVTDQIRQAIVGQLQANPSIQYVVLVGSDAVVPYRRAPNGTPFSEKSYFLDSRLKPGSPLFTSLWANANLTDDFYVDITPSQAQDTEFYIPDRAISRLVETPEEIGAQAQAFLDSNGQLNLSTASVAGYDFFTDGAQLTRDNLATKLSVNTLINDNWTATQLRNQLLGPPAPSVDAPFAHYTHYAALSAFGFSQNDPNDFFSSKVIAQADADSATPGVQPALARRVIFTVGCHAGLNVPDIYSLATDPGLGINPALDFPQAMAQQRSIFIASTGYGLGDNAGIGGTELLMAIFAKQLVDGDRVGNALKQAKLNYLSGLSTITEFDVKSSEQTVMYGLPMYHVNAGSASLSPALENLLAYPDASMAAASLNLTVQDGGSSTTSQHPSNLVTTADGNYYTTVDGVTLPGTQVTPGRAIQPRVAKSNLLNLGAGQNPVHGVFLKAGAFADSANFDPVIATPATEWDPNPQEIQACLDAFWPSMLTSVNSLDTDSTPGIDTQTLVVVPGAFRCDGLVSGKVKGTERLYSDLTLELLRSSSSDFKPPKVSSVQLTSQQNGSLNVVVDASDVETGNSGISRIVILVVSNGQMTSIDSGPLSGAGPYTVNIPGGIPAGAQLAIQVADGASNVTYISAKGTGGFSLIRVDLGPDQLFGPGIAVNFPVSVPDFDVNIPTMYFMDFGDGTFDSGAVSGPSFTLTHVYNAAAPNTVTASIQVANDRGGVGNDSVVLTKCSDPLDYPTDPNADLVACAATTNATPTSRPTTMTVTMRVAGSVEIGQSTYQYRLRINTGSTVYQIRYDDGNVTGPAGTTATVSGAELRITVSLAEIGMSNGGTVQLAFGTQAGKPAEPGTGQVDSMPDTGAFPFVIP